MPETYWVTTTCDTCGREGTSSLDKDTIGAAFMDKIRGMPRGWHSVGKSVQLPRFLYCSAECKAGGRAAELARQVEWATSRVNQEFDRLDVGEASNPLVSDRA
jgi:hypothetical protein